MKPCATNKLVIYDKIVINKIPLKPNSPRESLKIKVWRINIQNQ